MTLFFIRETWHLIILRSNSHTEVNGPWVNTKVGGGVELKLASIMTIIGSLQFLILLLVWQCIYIVIDYAIQYIEQHCTNETMFIMDTSELMSASAAASTSCFYSVPFTRFTSILKHIPNGWVLGFLFFVFSLFLFWYCIDVFLTGSSCWWLLPRGLR